MVFDALAIEPAAGGLELISRAPAGSSTDGCTIAVATADAPVGTGARGNAGRGPV